MGRIQRLPDDLVNKIAAGEVVERPASVVKELVENALDAGAATVTVEIEGGGKSLVRVRDDGCGMGREDARAALERHATSKLRELADLQAMGTHGFRGEALPSIASVSHLVLKTRQDGEAAGTEVEVRHGKPVHVRDTGHPRGTTVEVRDLFGAVPARRKFLRADSTEAAHVAEAVALLALARPATGFVLTSGGRTVIQTPAAESLAARLFQLYGAAILDDLLQLTGGEEWVRVRGFVSRPDRPVPSRAQLRLFVNGRAVRDRAISKAVLEACRAAGGGDRRPEAFLFLEVPLHLVDVNVHPSKIEVRFADPRTVFRAVERAVREGLSQGVRRRAPRADVTRVQEAAERYLAQATSGAPVQQAFAEPGARDAAPSERSSGLGAPVGETLFAEGAPTVLGQHRNTYIVASDGQDLLLVDQHTAHERVRFETLLAALARRVPESQLLLSPLIVTLDPSLRPLLSVHEEALAEVGFDVEPFGGGSLRLRAVPAALRDQDPRHVLESLLRDLLERATGQWIVSGARARLAATVACHSAVRAGQALGGEAMAAIVRDLGDTEHPSLCPHGRPTVVRVPRDDVARWFGRTGWRRQ
ncbi:MAG: DNA mismatch repair endonuclease MutL [Acidobacteria bacterium]|nr:DNA mismatch repair endonuclease MutL [Acidobacteriota bacterium]